MPRLVNSETGVTVNVDDDTAARLGSEWKPVEGKAAPAKKAAAKPPADKK